MEAGGFLAPSKGAHRVAGSKIRLGDFLLPGEALTWRWKDPSRGFLAPSHLAGGGKIRLGDDPFRTMIYSYSQERRSPGWRWKDPSRGFLAPNKKKALAGLEAERSMRGKIRLGYFLLPGEALAGLEAERSVSGISCSQKRRSPGWRLEDPSRRFLAPRRGAHRAGGGNPSRGFLAPSFLDVSVILRCLWMMSRSAASSHSSQ